MVAASLVAQGISLTVQGTLGLLCLRSRVGRDLRSAAVAMPASAVVEPSQTAN